MGNKKYKDNHKLKGLCINCGEPIWFPYIRCKKHTFKHRHDTKLKYNRYVKERRCVTCGNELHPDMDEGQRKCLNCREKSI